MSMLPSATIAQIARHDGQAVTLAGWVASKTEKGKLVFIRLRDGSGVIQCVVFKKNVPEEAFAAAQQLTLESSCRISGTVRADERAPGGYELDVADIEIVQVAPEYPIQPKEHGVEFLMEHRHLWVRSAKQHALLRIRAEVIAAAQEWLNDQGFVRFDTPILTPVAAEGTSNLFATEYFDLGPAYLAQTGQLYVESGMLSFGKVYCFGPTFRAEKSKTRRHLTEFWMIEPEVAFATHADNLVLQENFVSAIVQRCLERRGEELKVLERDTAALERCMPPFPRITYDDALAADRRSPGRGRGRDAAAVGRGLRRAARDADRLALRQAGVRGEVPGGDQGVLHGARPAAPRGGAVRRSAGARGLRRDHRRLAAHPRCRAARAADQASTA